MKILLLVSGLLVAAANSSLSADVKENWEKHCLKCHGADGKGQTKMGAKAEPKTTRIPKSRPN